MWLRHLRPLLYQRGLPARKRECSWWGLSLGASSVKTEVPCGGVALLDPCRPTAMLLSVRAVQCCHLLQHSVLCTTATCESVTCTCSRAPWRCGRLGAAGHKADQPRPRAVRLRPVAAQLLRYQVMCQSGRGWARGRCDVSGQLVENGVGGCRCSVRVEVFM
jgi:hypothetical protein